MRLLFALVSITSLIAAEGGHAGAQACASCHKNQTQHFGATSMARALELVPSGEILRTNPLLKFREGIYSYTIQRDKEQSLYTVTDGKETVTLPLSYAFGLGAAGQTYVYERDGAWYESRVSYYRAINGLDLTIGARNAAPRNLEEAAGRKMDGQGTLECFNCHSTNSVKANRLQVQSLTPGVSCERCHGSAEKHLDGLRTGNLVQAKMKKLGGMAAEDMADFCGQCHRTWAQIATSGPHNVNNVRFQPYRLTLSKCYDATDARLSCTACHDPHKEVVAETASYDSKCTACHQVKGTLVSKTARVKACPVQSKNCVQCHMPRVELPGSHTTFADHRIRIVRAGEGYPD